MDNIQILFGTVLMISIVIFYLVETKKDVLKTILDHPELSDSKVESITKLFIIDFLKINLLSPT